MAQYSVHVFCDECGETHTMRVDVSLDDGPAEKASLGDTYQGRDLPQNIVNMINNSIQCPKTGKMVLQRDNN
jgi:predicted RNA-binding Zn-ribbon protein involved in translation (DUF1610 family)